MGGGGGEDGEGTLEAVQAQRRRVKRDPGDAPPPLPCHTPVAPNDNHASAVCMPPLPSIVKAHLVGRRIHLGDDEPLRGAGRELDELAELLVDGRERLAVAAPGRVELDKHILRGIQRDVGESRAHKHRDGPRGLLAFGHGRALQRRLERA